MSPTVEPALRRFWLPLGRSISSVSRAAGPCVQACRSRCASRPLRSLCASVLLASFSALPSGPADAQTESAPRQTGDGASDSAERARLQRELERQQRMLRRLQRGESLEDTDLAPLDALPEPMDGDDVDLRVAPAAPVDRPLPVAIFDQRDVTIEPGTWGNRERLRLTERSLDADGDGRPELVRWADRASDQLVRQEEDRNFNGRIDAWSDYEEGRIVARALDRNEDASPDVWERYADGRMTHRESDRDFDGVRDAFYAYRDGWLHEERLDADNDGRIDLRVYYSDRYRTRAEEDRDKDGRMDTWRWWQVVDGVELISRVEIDSQGRGFADTFEVYEPMGGRALLARRDEDLDGDGEIDVASYYSEGRLMRREILAPDKFKL